MCFLIARVVQCHRGRALAANERVVFNCHRTRSGNVLEKIFHRIARLGFRARTCAFGAAIAAALLSGCAGVTHPTVTSANGESQPASASPSIEVTTQLGNDARFIEGDTIQLLLSLKNPAYVVLVLEDASGRIFRIFPTDPAQPGAVSLTAGRYQLIPSAQQGYTVTAPFGRETVWALASTRPLPGFTGTHEETFLRLHESMDQLRQRMAAYAGQCDCVVEWDRVSFRTAADTLAWPDR